MAFKTDIEIARGAQKQPIQEVGAKLGIEAGDLLAAIRDGGQAYPSMQDALDFERVIHAVADSAGQGCTRVTF